jgi:hypothetical protein
MSLWTRSITGRLSLAVDQNCFITVIGEAHRKMTCGKSALYLIFGTDRSTTGADRSAIGRRLPARTVPQRF